MTKFISVLLAAMFALVSTSVMACPGDKAKDEQQISKPAKPKA